MCGLAGFTGPGADAPAIVRRMIAALAHRGPDGNGEFTDAGIALGHNRLAVIDLAGGAQPRVDAASGDALIFNGEIYGYRTLAGELRDAGVELCDRSDTEVLFQMLRRSGIRETLSKIDGMFAFAFRDGRSSPLYLARDRFGEKPLFYGLAGGNLVFGSELSALRCHPAFRDSGIDRDAAFQFLTYEYLPGNRSGREGISKLPPGHLLGFADGRITIEAYWQPPRGEAHTASDEAAAGSLGRASWACTTVAAPWTQAGTADMSRARNERSHSPPSPNVPQTIQHGLTARQIRSPASASPCSRHQFSTRAALPASTS